MDKKNMSACVESGSYKQADGGARGSLMPTGKDARLMQSFRVSLAAEHHWTLLVPRALSRICALPFPSVTQHLLN